eukprot:jgi/Ulvmu1/2457/UM136_0009.1
MTARMCKCDREKMMSLPALNHARPLRPQQHATGKHWRQRATTPPCCPQRRPQHTAAAWHTSRKAIAQRHTAAAWELPPGGIPHFKGTVTVTSCRRLQIATFPLVHAC